VKNQQRQQRTLLRRPKRDRAMLIPNLERAKQVELELASARGRPSS
jgi:hypothetical protein